MEDVAQDMLGIPVESHDMGHLLLPQRDLHSIGLFLQEIAGTGKQKIILGQTYGELSAHANKGKTAPGCLPDLIAIAYMEIFGVAFSVIIY